MTSREAGILASLTEAAVAPPAPLPATQNTDAVAAFGRYLRASPRANRIGLRAGLIALDEGARLLGYGAPLRRLAPADRDAYLTRLQSTRVRPLVETLCGLTQFFYYGDETVMGILGYDPVARVTRGRELRERERRW